MSAVALDCSVVLKWFFEEADTAVALAHHLRAPLYTADQRLVRALRKGPVAVEVIG